MLAMRHETPSLAAKRKRDGATLTLDASHSIGFLDDGLRRQTVTSAATTNFIWDGQDVLLATDGSNNTQVTYTQIPNMYGGR